MADTYDEAVEELYQVPHAEFVAERKRLAEALKPSDKAGASKLAKQPRPPISAWAVNQLWWQAREDFEAMLAAAADLRDGDLGASAAHREAIAELRNRAATILTAAGNAASEATLRRIATTLAAISATGGFAPDPDGALGDDRDPPGFEVMGIGPSPTTKAPVMPRPAVKPGVDPAIAEAKVAAAIAAREKAEAEVAATKRRTDRQRIEAALRTAHGDVESRKKEVERLKKQLANLEESVEQAEATVEDLEGRLRALDDD